MLGYGKRCTWKIGMVAYHTFLHLPRYIANVSCTEQRWSYPLFSRTGKKDFFYGYGCCRSHAKHTAATSLYDGGLLACDFFKRVA